MLVLRSHTAVGRIPFSNSQTSGLQAGLSILSTPKSQILEAISDKPRSVRVSVVVLKERPDLFFHGRNPQTQLCCSTHKCVFLTDAAPFKAKQTGFPMVRHLLTE